MNGQAVGILLEGASVWLSEIPEGKIFGGL
jgi:hypothetical protein